MENKDYWLKKEGTSGEFDYIDQDGISHNSPKEWLWSILGGCGCGSDFSEKAFRVLELFATEHAQRTWSVYDNESDEILAQWMDSVGLLEHGTSVGGSWLTRKGEQIYKSIKELSAT